MQVLGWALIVLLGALAFMPVVSYFDFAPLPGDVRFNVGDWHVYAPFTTALIPSVVLALLFWLLRR